MQDQRSDLEELLRKFCEFQHTFPVMSADTKREFESIMRMVKRRLAENGKSQAAD